MEYSEIVEAVASLYSNPEERDKMIDSMKLDLYIQLTKSTPNPSSQLFRAGFIDFFSTGNESGSFHEAFFSAFADTVRTHDLNYQSTFVRIANEMERRGPRQEVHASFASEMLATIDTSLLIFDSYVERGLSRYTDVRLAPRVGNIDKRLEVAISNYQAIQHFYDCFLASADGHRCVDGFDEAFGRQSAISDQKKIDFSLWRLGWPQDAGTQS